MYPELVLWLLQRELERVVSEDGDSHDNNLELEDTGNEAETEGNGKRKANILAFMIQVHFSARILFIR